MAVKSPARIARQPALRKVASWARKVDKSAGSVRGGWSKLITQLPHAAGSKRPNASLVALLYTVLCSPPTSRCQPAQPLKWKWTRLKILKFIKGVRSDRVHVLRLDEVWVRGLMDSRQMGSGPLNGRPAAKTLEPFGTAWKPRIVRGHEGGSSCRYDGLPFNQCIYLWVFGTTHSTYTQLLQPHGSP